MFIVSATAQLLCPPQVGSKKYFDVVHEKQQMHAWFPTFLKTKCCGNLMLYVQHASKVTIVCPGSNVWDTVEIFRVRLANLLFRYCSEAYQIDYSLELLEHVDPSREFSRQLFLHSGEIKETIKREIMISETDGAMSLDKIEDEIIAYYLGLHTSSIFQCKSIR